METWEDWEGPSKYILIVCGEKSFNNDQKIAILIDSRIIGLIIILQKEHLKVALNLISIFLKIKKIKKYDIVFVIGYTKILKKNF